MDDQNYIDLVKNQIKLDKLLHSIKPENHDKAKALFNKKKEIIQKNGFWADLQLKKINKQIDKLKKTK